MTEITYQDIKKVSDNLSVRVTERTFELRRVADSLIQAYSDSLKLESRSFRDESGKEKQYVETYIDNRSGLTPCLIGEIPVDEYHEMMFYIRTALNDNPNILYHLNCHDYLKYVDVHIRIKIEDRKIMVYIMKITKPIIVPIEPISGQFSQVADAIKQTVISIINSHLPK